MAVPTASKVVKVANALLERVGLPQSVQSLENCDWILFSQLYEALTGTIPPGGGGAEVSRCQAVVDALAQQLAPHVSLDHIRGSHLADRDTLTINNLLDIFSVLFHLPVTSMEGSPQQTPQSEEKDSNISNILSSRGHSVISELIREELGSTDSTADLLCPLPQPYSPSKLLLGLSSSSLPHHSPLTHSLTTSTTLTNTSTTSEDTTGGEGGGEIYEERGGGRGEGIRGFPHPVPSPSLPSTPPPSHNPLISPLHHSTPHNITKSRVFPLQPPPTAPSTTTLTHTTPSLPTLHTHTAPSLTTHTAPSLTTLTTHTAPSLTTLPTHTAPSLPLSQAQMSTTHQAQEVGGGRTAPPPPVLLSLQTNESESEEDDRGGGSGGTEQKLGHIDSRLLKSTVATQTNVCLTSPAPSTLPSSVPLVALSPTVSSPDHTAWTGDTPELDHTDTQPSCAASQPSPPEIPHRGARATKFSSGRPRVHFSSAAPHYQRTLEEPLLAEGREGGGGGRREGGRGGRREGGGIRKGGERTAEVRKDVLASLYQSYLRELRATQPSQRGKRRRRKHCSHSHTSPTTAGKSKHEDKENKEEEEKEEEGGKENEENEPNLPTEISPEDDLLPLVWDALPSCPVSPATLRRLWRRQLLQITTLSKHTLSRPKTTSKLSDMERKHNALLGAIRKEIEHTERTKQQEVRKAQQRAIKSHLQARRHASARARRYYTDYELRLKAKMQKKRTREEQIFRRVFEDGLGILRDRAREVHRFAQEKAAEEGRLHHQELEAMEHYYHDQFSMLVETLAREKEEVAVRDKAQKRLAQRLHRELHQRLEKEIQQLQDGLDRDEDAAHFRELDAEQMRHNLRTLPLRLHH